MSQKTATATVEQEACLYSTSDKPTCIALMMKYRVIQVRPENEERLVYYFNLEETRKVALITDEGELVYRDLSVREMIDLIRSGRSHQILFTLNELWTAEQTWIVNLRHNNFTKKKQ